MNENKKCLLKKNQKSFMFNSENVVYVEKTTPFNQKAVQSPQSYR